MKNRRSNLARRGLTFVELTTNRLLPRSQRYKLMESPFSPWVTSALMLLEVGLKMHEDTLSPRDRKMVRAIIKDLSKQ